MKLRNAAIRFCVVLVAASALAVKVGNPAPGFTAVDVENKQQKLSDFKGKYVVLEWHNQGCPYTRKHYESGNMQRLQKEWTAKGVVWLTVISSVPGTQGFVTPGQEKEYLKQMNAAPTDVLIDPVGTLGRLYEAKATPQMYVIDPAGTLIYQGAIDDKPSSDKADIPKAKNYISAALTESLAGKPVTEATTSPYGCSIKYPKF
jgi:thioredoxin-related protein